MIISIEGNIGSGKSTILDHLKTKENVVQEDLINWGTWIKDFYKKPEKNSFGFQMRVLLSQSYVKNNKNIIFHERSPFTCNNIFGNILKKQNHLSDAEHLLCLEFAEKYCWEPDYIIYIKTKPEICKQRILKRDREGENIDIQYLNLVHDYHEKMYNKENNKIYFVEGNQTKEEIIYDINTILDEIKINLNKNSFLNKI